MGEGAAYVQLGIYYLEGKIIEPDESKVVADATFPLMLVGTGVVSQSSRLGYGRWYFLLCYDFAPKQGSTSG